MIVLCEDRWVHYSDDDWKGQVCECANSLRSCRPPQKTRVRTEFTLRH